MISVGSGFAAKSDLLPIFQSFVILCFEISVFVCHSHLDLTIHEYFRFHSRISATSGFVEGIFSTSDLVVKLLKTSQLHAMHLQTVDWTGNRVEICRRSSRKFPEALLGFRDH